MIFKELRCLCAYRLGADLGVLIYGSCRAIREFAWRVDRPVVDSARNCRSDRGRRQPALLPRLSGAMSAGVGSGLDRLWSVSVGSGCWRIARRVEVGGRVRSSRFRAGDGLICGGRSDVGAGTAGADGLGGGFVGVDSLRHDAAALFS